MPGLWYYTSESNIKQICIIENVHLQMSISPQT